MLIVMENQTSNIKYEEEYIVNPQGVELFTCRWVSENPDNHKALIFLCHGYGMECSFSMKDCATRLVEAGYKVHGIDCRGHGKSSGLKGLISNFDDLVDDLSLHFTSIAEKPENRDKMRILLGESMGGAMALRLHRKKPDYWDGAVLVAPMCRIADNLKPNPVVRKMLSALARVGPQWKLPGSDIIDVAFRDPKVRKEVRSNPYTYTGRARLQTGDQLLKVSLDLEKRLEEVLFPFIVLHGEEDKVTDPSTSKLLYETAKSGDKTLKLYPGMWHSLTYGELPENLDTVFSDVIKWLDERVLDKKKEEQQKLVNDVVAESSAYRS